MYAVTASNPKGIVFYVGFIPQFIDPAGNSTRQLWTLGVTFIVLATLNAALYTAFAFSVRNWLASRAAQRACNLVGGSVLIGAGYGLSHRLIESWHRSVWRSRRRQPPCIRTLSSRAFSSAAPLAVLSKMHHTSDARTARSASASVLIVAAS
jgi:hypothetical protein